MSPVLHDDGSLTARVEPIAFDALCTVLGCRETGRTYCVPLPRVVGQITASMTYNSTCARWKNKALRKSLRQYWRDAGKDMEKAQEE